MNINKDELMDKLICIKFYINLLQYKLGNNIHLTKKDKDLLQFLDHNYYLIQEREEKHEK